jgi:hypothetical protein
MAPCVIRSFTVRFVYRIQYSKVSWIAMTHFNFIYPNFYGSVTTLYHATVFLLGISDRYRLRSTNFFNFILFWNEVICIFPFSSTLSKYLRFNYRHICNNCHSQGYGGHICNNCPSQGYDMWIFIYSQVNLLIIIILIRKYHLYCYSPFN